MVTETIRCPSCGANDDSHANARGEHTCRYCGVRYMVSGGRPMLLDARGNARPANSNRGLWLVAAGLFAAVFLVGLLIAFQTARTPAPTTNGAGPNPPARVDLTPTAPVPRTDLGAPASTASQAENRPDPTGTFTIDHHHALTDAYLRFYGTFTNTSPYPVSRPTLQVVLRNAAGEEVSAGNGYPDFDFVAEGATIPVMVQIPNADFATAEPLFQFQNFGHIPAQATGLRLEPGAVNERSGRRTFNGTVYNEGDTPARFVRVVVAGYDADGGVVGLGTTFAAGQAPPIAPGGSARFSAMAVTFAAEPVRFEYFVAGKPALR